MIKTKEEIINAIKGKIGEDTSDETLALLEDISDTLNDYDNKTKDTEDWKAKYEENDKEWRQRYRDRFFNKDDGEGKDEEFDDLGENLDDNKPHTFEDLFSKGE